MNCSSWICDGAVGCVLAVVPVFVNAGAALLPALVGVLASFFTILFRPRPLLRLCREKPYRVAAVATALVAGGGLVLWLAGGGESHVRDRRNEAEGKWTGSIMTPNEWVRLARALADESTADTSGPKAPVGASIQEGAVFFRGGNSRTGYLSGDSPTDLTRLWSYTEEHAMFWSTPIIRGSRVYSAWCLLDPPNSQGAVVCVDANTGNRIWEVAMKDAQREFKGFFSSPALTADGRFLIIGQGLHPDYDSELVCIDAEKGIIKWLVPCPLHIEGSPAIEGDLVVVGAGAVEDPATHAPKKHGDPVKNENPGYVFAVRISTGEVLWKHVLNDPESSPAVENGIVYIGSGYQGNAVAALRLRESDDELRKHDQRREIWKTSTPYPATGAITLTDELVLVGCGKGDYVYRDPAPAGAVIALDKKTGRIRWSQAMPDAVLGAIAVQGRTAIAPIRNGEVVALDLSAADAAHRVLWRTVARQGAQVLAGPAFTGTHVYVVTHDGYLVVMDAKTGKALQSLYINAEPGEMGMSIGSPSVAAGRIFVGSETGGLRCYGSKN